MRASFSLHLRALRPWLVFVSLTVFRASAAPALNTANATAFFTNVTMRLLLAEGKPSITHIVIYPTNQYTPSVHRLLQLTANLYDAATNHFVSSSSALAWPTVFRPLFRTETNGQIFIAGYREVLGTDMAFAGSAPLMVELDTGKFISFIPPSGTPFNPSDQNEPMVSGVPLIIGAKKGWPNFNQFAMQTTVNVSRRLQFLRHDPVNDATNQLPYATNQQYRVAISNVFGLQAWNSYSNNFPRDLQLIATANMTAVITNELGTLLLSNRVAQGAVSSIMSGTWAGFTNANNAQGSFQLPFNPTSSYFFFLINSVYSQSQQRFLSSASFENPSGFYVPRWWLSIHPRVHLILLDTAAQRIVDYVNLDAPSTQLDLTEDLTIGGSCSDPYVPDGTIGSIFCTNRGNYDQSFPTYGILNQIEVSLYGANGSQGGIPGASWNSFLQTPAGYDAISSVNFFRTNFRIPPMPGTPPSMLYLTNEFYAPYSPTRSINIYTDWSVNDPLVHYTLSDLKAPVVTNIELESTSQSPIPDFISGRVSRRFSPWGGGPFEVSIPIYQKFDLTRKDPLVMRSDGWNFPTSQTLDPAWLGRVHRGTPWQTLYLKPYPADSALWKTWLNISDDQEAQALQPTNDWRLVSLLALLFNTNDVRSLRPVSESPAAWLQTLDGIAAITNSTTDSEIISHLRPPEYWIPPYDTITMTSNSPQASTIANAVVANSATRPDRFFHWVGDILATPELSTTSPWISTSSIYQSRYGITDAAYETIPSQLLALLRPDSIATILQTSPNLQIQFTGADGYAYAIQTSSNLLDWSSVTTKYPINGTFVFSENQAAGSSLRFYRSVLLP